MARPEPISQLHIGRKRLSAPQSVSGATIGRRKRLFLQRNQRSDVNTKAFLEISRNKLITLKYLFFTLAMGVMACNMAQNATPAKQNNMQSTNVTPSGQIELATLGGGCFWCIETLFQDLQGVSKVESGYAGGHVDNPTYSQICTGATGHAEVIQISFDPAIIAYADILDVFFTMHDPTTLNRQGNDVGTQYRSAIYYHSDAQKEAAKAAKAAAAKDWSDPIVTEITEFDKFYKAEQYHQNYYKDNPNQPYCSFVIAPKVKKFKEKYAAKLRQ
jgi:peptide-methionine (S)-S-oxide reductase